MLNLWRRHLKSCPHRRKGRSHTKCSCPVWCDGEVDGTRYRHRDFDGAHASVGEGVEDGAELRRILHADDGDDAEPLDLGGYFSS